MLAYRHVKPSRCAYGANYQTAPMAGYAFVALYNDSGAPYVLAVHDFAISNAANTIVGGMAVVQGNPGTSPVQGMPVVSNRQQMAGQVTIGAVGALPSFGYFTDLNGAIFGSATSSGAWLHEFPMFVITPGWSLVTYPLSITSDFGVSYWWQVLTPEELDEMYGD